MSERTDRLDQLLREEISAIIAKDLADPRIGFVTVTEVDVAPDLGHATVWVSVIGDAAAQKASLRALGRAMPYVRHRLGGLHLRKIPELHLRHDDSIERGTRVLRLIDEVEHDTDATEAPEPLGTLPEPTTARGHATPPTPARPRKERTTTPGSAKRRTPAATSRKAAHGGRAERDRDGW
ncbi:MAG: 30S ribosome-binding factor RbfA [Chloroflexota bacterium]